MNYSNFLALIKAVSIVIVACYVFSAGELGATYNRSFTAIY